MNGSIYNNGLQEIINEIAKQKEEILNDALNDLISTGLLVVEQGPATLFPSHDLNKYVFKQSCRLVLKDKEYIQRLEAENKDLNERLKMLAAAIRDVENG